jgi:hypothetical protein
VAWRQRPAALQGTFDLVLCSPPYFHPSKTSTVDGAASKIRDMDLFAEWTAQILARTSKVLRTGQPLCFVKTDVKYKNTVLPIGFRIADRYEKLGLPIQAHWIRSRYAQVRSDIGDT